MVSSEEYRYARFSRQIDSSVTGGNSKMHSSF